MTVLAEILKYILPSLIVLATAWLFMKSFFDRELENRKSIENLEIRKSVLPVRLQAYERLMLLLERLQPAGLILRANRPGMSARELQGAMLQSIREEFEHNLSQQLYVTAQAWEKVKEAREESIRRINNCAGIVQEGSSADLAGKILVMDIDTGGSKLDEAILFLKREAEARFF